MADAFVCEVVWPTDDVSSWQLPFFGWIGVGVEPLPRGGLHLQEILFYLSNLCSPAAQ